ncbi:hypothetical protein CDIK_0527 [Cucumispora dikerogammari]|nr:hypothetical protein CDIK_0527 [Cucumispora dikerogammari]
MDDISEIHDTSFDLKTYINKKHPTYNVSILKTSLIRLKHINEKNNNKLLKMFDQNTMNSDVFKQVDKLTTKLKNTLLTAETEQNLSLTQPNKEFYSELNIKKFKDSLKKFQENLDVFITEKRRLEFETACFFVKQKLSKEKEEEKEIKFDALKWIEGNLILTNDILFIGRKETNGFLLVENALYGILQKYIVMRDFNMTSFFNNNPTFYAQDKHKNEKEFSILAIKTPSNIIYVLMETRQVMTFVSVFDRCTLKKIKPKYKKKDFDKIQYFLETEQHEEIQKLIDKNSSLVKNKDSFIAKSLLKKVVGNLQQQTNTLEDLSILLQIVDPVVLLTKIFKQNFPIYEMENYIEKYFEFFTKFFEETNEVLKEVRKKNKNFEIVEINLLVKEKATKFILKKCMKQILWRGRKTNEVDSLVEELSNKVELKYLLKDYTKNIEKWKRCRKEFGKYQISDLAKHINQ